MSFLDDFTDFVSDAVDTIGEAGDLMRECGMRISCQERNAGLRHLCFQCQCEDDIRAAESFALCVAILSPDRA